MEFSTKSIALKWFYFFCPGSVSLYSEFCHLFMKQLSFSPQQIGSTSVLGIQHFFIPLFLLFGDKFRARKMVATIAIVGIIITSFVPLFPLLVPLPTCFTAPLLTSNHSTDITVLACGNASMRLKNSTKDTTKDESQHLLQQTSTKTKPSQYKVPWLSTLFLLILTSRLLNVTLDCVIYPLGNLATITYLKDERTKYGAYYMWNHVGAAVSIFIVAVLAWNIKIIICGVESYGYFTMFIVATCMSMLSLFSLPWFDFEYNEKAIDWFGVKSVLFNVHYASLLLITFYTGLCVSFQRYWEFWYLDGLSAGPLIMGGAALIRRPLLAASSITSIHLLRKIGDLKTLCLALLLYALSYLALSFTRIPWLVLSIDVFQATAYGLGYCALTVHFSKAGSKENTGIILGLKDTVFAIGFDAGSTVIGVLFNALGTQKTLLIYSISSSLVLVCLLLYIYFSKRVEDYEKLAHESNEE